MLTYETDISFMDYTWFLIGFDDNRSCIAIKKWYSDTEWGIYFFTADCFNNHGNAFDSYARNNIYVISGLITFPSDGTKIMTVRRARTAIMKSEDGVTCTGTAFHSYVKLQYKRFFI